MRAPSRNSRRPRSSLERATSLKELVLLTVVAMESLRFLDLAAGRLDGRARTLGDRDALERHGLLELTREDHLDPLGAHRHHLCLDEGCEVDERALDLGELVQAHFRARRLHGRAEAHLRHAALDRHLAAFEADLVVAALARALPLGAAAAGLALAGGGAAADAQARALGARARFH